MSLKWFHVFFIGMSVLLSLFVTTWAMVQAEWILAFVAAATATILIAYEEAFLEKTRQL